MATYTKCKHYFFTHVKAITLSENSLHHNPGIYEIPIVLAGKYNVYKESMTEL